MDNDTIVNNDVSAEVDAAGEITEPGTHDLDTRPALERDRALASIARAHEESMGLTREEEDDDGDLDADAADDSGLDAGGAAEGGIPDDLSELGFYRNDAGALVTKIKVNGQEREVTADQFGSFIQKDLAGDAKLREAHEREQRLIERERILQEQESLIQKVRDKPQPSAEDAAQLVEKAKAALQKQWAGDDEEAAQALVTLLQEASRGNATIDPDEVVAIAKRESMSVLAQRQREEAEARWNDSVSAGNRMLQTKHPEIWQDDTLFDLVNSRTARMLQLQAAGDPDHVNLLPEQIISKAAESVQEWVSGKRDVKQPGERNARAARKDGLKPMPKGMSTTQKPAPKQAVDMSTKAVIERMAAARATSIHRGA